MGMDGASESEWHTHCRDLLFVLELFSSRKGIDRRFNAKDEREFRLLLVSDEYLQSRLLPPWRRKRLMFLPDPWDPDEFAVLSKASAREALGLTLNVPIVLMFGELSRRKGVDTMLDALARLPASTRVQALFAGRMCPDVRARYHKQIAELRARGRLLWREEFVPSKTWPPIFALPTQSRAPIRFTFPSQAIQRLGRRRRDARSSYPATAFLAALLRKEESD